MSAVDRPWQLGERGSHGQDECRQAERRACCAAAAPTDVEEPATSKPAVEASVQANFIKRASVREAGICRRDASRPSRR